VDLSASLAEREPALVAWPENTISMALNVAPEQYRNPDVRARAEGISQALAGLAGAVPEARFLVGAPYMALEMDPSGYGMQSKGYSVSAWYLDPAAYGSPGVSPDSQFLGRYDKIKLVPFGEYVPYVDKLPFLARLTPIGRSSIAGTEYDVFDLPTGGDPVRFSALICYDDCFPEVTARFRRAGAQFMINVTYEGWYYVPGELRQHMAMAVFRAVETRAGMVRAANTGISCFIDPRGRVYARLPAWKPGALAAPVRLSDDVPFYARHGDVFAVLCLAIGLAATGAGLFLRKGGEPEPEPEV
jgi:apolipoprotein N-acyltransferase